MANKKQWDKAVHATVLIDPRLTQDDWHHLNRTTVVAAEPAADPEPRVYNPSGPFYNMNKPVLTAEPKKE